MTSDYDATQRTNYYQWRSSLTSAQDYDIVVNVQIPSDYVDGLDAASNFKFMLWDDDGDAGGTASQVTWSLVDASGTSCFSTTFNGTADTWVEKTATASGCTFAANDIITLRFKLYSQDSSGTVYQTRIGGMEFSYTN